MLYILNSPIITSYGIYTYKRISKEDAISLLKNNQFVSAVGHEPTAQFLSTLFQIPIPMNRVTISMQTGDQAIVFKLLDRLPEGRVLSLEELKSIRYEIGLLEKIE